MERANATAKRKQRTKRAGTQRDLNRKLVGAPKRNKPDAKRIGTVKGKELIPVINNQREIPLPGHLTVDHQPEKITKSTSATTNNEIEKKKEARHGD